MHMTVPQTAFKNHHENVDGNAPLYIQQMNKWTKWYVQVKSKHNFVRPTMKRKATAPMKAFNTNDNITDRPPESVTWISYGEKWFVYEDSPWWDHLKFQAKSVWEMLTWYWNRWSNVWFAPTKTSIMAINMPKLTYRIDWTAIIWAINSNGSHCVFRNPVFIFIFFI